MSSSMQYKNRKKTITHKIILTQKNILRFAISFLFILFGAWEIYAPAYWAPFFPNLINISNATISVIISIHGILLLIIGLAIITGYKLKAFALFGTIMMVIISLSLFYLSGITDLFIRDVAITIATAALMLD